MIYTVTFNPSLDYIIDLDEFRQGYVNRGNSESIFAGGKGINVSIVLKNLGYENSALGFLAGFSGNEILRLIKKEKVNPDFIELENGFSRINVKLRGLEESEINGSGPEISQDEIEKLYDKLDRLREGDVLVLAGSIPAGLTNDTYKDILRYLDGRGIKIVVDATGQLLTNTLKYHPFLIKPNKSEAEEILKCRINNAEDAIECAKKFQNLGATNVIISLSEKGAVLLTEDKKTYICKAPKGKVINTVGSGDSMVAGFLAAYLETNDYEKALERGVEIGSKCAFLKGLPTEDDI